MKTIDGFLIQAIERDLRNGFTHRATATRYGVCTGTVARVAKTFKLSPSTKTPAEHMRAGDFRTITSHQGFVGWLLSMPDEVVNWLAEEAQNGALVSDIVRGIVVDAYHAEADRLTQTAKKTDTPATGQKTGVCE